MKYIRDLFWLIDRAIISPVFLYALVFTTALAVSYIIIDITSVIYLIIICIIIIIVKILIVSLSSIIIIIIDYYQK